MSMSAFKDQKYTKRFINYHAWKQKSLVPNLLRKISCWNCKRSSTRYTRSFYEICDEINFNYDYNLNHSVSSINDSTIWKLEDTLTLRDRWRIEDLAHSLLSLSFPQVKSRSRSMSHDITSDRFLGITVSHSCTSTRISHDLISNEDGNIELLTDLLQSAEHLAKNVLPFR